MAISSTRLSTTSSTSVYTSVGTNAVTTIVACNTGVPNLADETINAANLTLHLVASGSPASDTNTIVKNLTIPAGETVFFSDEKVILSNGDSIVAQASAAPLISITVSTLPV